MRSGSWVGIGTAIAFAGLAFLRANLADASPCDDVREAWAVLDAGIGAGTTDPHAVERAVAPLTDPHCSPAGAHPEWIARARLEARLLVLEAHADAARVALTHMPRQTGRGGDAYRTWIRRAIAPWITTQMAAIRAVMNETTALANDARFEPGIAADTISAAIQTELALVDAIRAIPVPEELRRDPEMERTYRSLIEENTAALSASVRDGYTHLAALARREAILPRAARRVEAMLLAQGRITAAERANARPTATVSSGSPPSSSPAPGARGTVEAGRPQGDAAAVRQVRDSINGASNAMRSCYEQGLDRDRALRGEITLRLVLGPNGPQVTLTRAEGAMRPVAQCMADAIRALPLPASSAPVTVEVPFHLEPTAPESNLTIP